MTSNVKAILTCLLAYFFFDIMSVHVRILSINYSPQELSVYRNVIGVLPAIFYLWYSKELSLKISDYKLEQWKLAISRGLVIAIAQLCLHCNSKTGISNRICSRPGECSFHSFIGNFHL